MGIIGWFMQRLVALLVACVFIWPLDTHAQWRSKDHNSPDYELRNIPFESHGDYWVWGGREFRNIPFESRGDYWGWEERHIWQPYCGIGVELAGCPTTRPPPPRY